MPTHAHHPPTDERARQAEGIDLPDFKPWWTVQSRLDALLRDRLIDTAEHCPH